MSSEDTWTPERTARHNIAGIHHQVIDMGGTACLCGERTGTNRAFTEHIIDAYDTDREVERMKQGQQLADAITGRRNGAEVVRVGPKRWAWRIWKGGVVTDSGTERTPERAHRAANNQEARP